MATEASHQLPICADSDASSNEIYRVHPLGIGISTNIRLLTLLPDSSMDDSTTITLGIDVFPLEEATQYTALSYVWGQDAPTKLIVLDGRVIAIRSSLWDFLARISAVDDHSLGYLWIDALCIDQSSIPERNYQVAIMGHIFFRASLVITWLGAGRPDLENAVRELSENWKDSKQSLKERREVRLKEREAAIVNIGEAEYWRRMWTVQEFVIPKKVEIWCRQECMHSEVLCDFLMATSAVLDDIPHLGLVQRSCAMRMFAQLPLPDRPIQHLAEVLACLHEAPGQCADIKDRVYSVLMLATDKDYDQHPVAVDYNKTSSDLFIDLFGRRHRQLDQDGDTPYPAKLVQVAYLIMYLQEVLEVKGQSEVLLRQACDPFISQPSPRCCCCGSRHPMNLRKLGTDLDCFARTCPGQCNQRWTDDIDAAVLLDWGTSEDRTYFIPDLVPRNLPFLVDHSKAF